MTRSVLFLNCCLRATLLTLSLGLIACASTPYSTPIPNATRNQSPTAHIVVDYHTGKVFMASNERRKQPVASLTKVATACVVLDWAERTNANLGQRAVVPPSVTALAAVNSPNPFGFAPGDTLSLRDALSCAMMGSDNFAAESLAWHVGAAIQRQTGQSGSPYTVFIDQMNNLAGVLKMDSTSFTNPHGLDNTGTVPLSTAADMARLTLYAQKKPAFSFYTSQKERRITVYRGGSQEEKFLLKNLNTALGRAGIDGVKTGMTQRAGQCLILSAPRKNIVIRHSAEEATIIPRRLVVVLLASNNRFPEAEALLSQGWATYDQWHDGGRIIASAAEMLTP